MQLTPVFCLSYKGDLKSGIRWGQILENWILTNQETPIGRPETIETQEKGRNSRKYLGGVTNGAGGNQIYSEYCVYSAASAPVLRLCRKSSTTPRLNDVPRLRGRPAGRLGQPFYGWLGGATIGSLGRFNGLLRIRPLKRPEANYRRR